MIWLLNRFPEFRELRDGYARLEEVAKDALRRASQAERESALKGQTIAVQQEALRGAQANADFFCQRVTGRKIYENMPALPEGAPGPVPIYRSKMQARELVNAGNLDFIEEQRQLLNRPKLAAPPVAGVKAHEIYRQI